MLYLKYIVIFRTTLTTLNTTLFTEFVFFRHRFGYYLGTIYLCIPRNIKPGRPYEQQQYASWLCYIQTSISFVRWFSARAVHKILNVLIESIETFISGSTRDILQRRTALAKAQSEQEINALKLNNQQIDIGQRMQSTAKLMELKQQLSNKNEAVELDQKLNLIINELMAPMGVNIDFDSSKTVLNYTKSNTSEASKFTADSKEGLPSVEQDILVDYEIPEFPAGLDNKSYIESKEKNSSSTKLN